MRPAVRGMHACMQVVYEQLVKHVGMEGRGGAGAGGGAVVINTSHVNANPINRLLAAPVTTNLLQVRVRRGAPSAEALSVACGKWFRRMHACGQAGMHIIH